MSLAHIIASIGKRHKLFGELSRVLEMPCRLRGERQKHTMRTPVLRWEPHLRATSGEYRVHLAWAMLQTAERSEREAFVGVWVGPFCLCF